ncbi:unnamed protein product [Linum tenue]|uniref:Fe2OG dioxygenase domain-containing protein n=1 Tax=Linum tenue TaxID=586396 RepID=A0AAV0HU17_9ROSI|nr:unnamed protein product [Linum tenue]
MEYSVHELAITGENPPAKYIYTDSINPSQDPSIPLPLLEIPVIDFNRITTPSVGTGAELERLRSALSSYGCVMDGTVITYLLQDGEVEGLQVLKDEQWFRVPNVPDALVLHVGDHLEIMSNGEFKSPVHRVVLNPERQRMSVVIASFPEEGRQIEPLEGLVSGERPRLYRQVKYSIVDQVGYYWSGTRVTDDARI